MEQTWTDVHREASGALRFVLCFSLGSERAT